MANIFEPGSSHTATLTVKSSSTVPMTFDIVLGLGSAPLTYAASVQEAVTLAAGEQKAVSLVLVAPMVQAIYGVYVDIYYEGVLVLGFVGTEAVTVYAVPSIQIIDITWT